MRSKNNKIVLVSYVAEVCLSYYIFKLLIKIHGQALLFQI